jgi:hypothetical protein
MFSTNITSAFYKLGSDPEIQLSLFIPAFNILDEPNTWEKLNDQD